MYDQSQTNAVGLRRSERLQNPNPPLYECLMQANISTFNGQCAQNIVAKFDSGACRSAISHSLAIRLGLPISEYGVCELRAAYGTGILCYGKATVSLGMADDQGVERIRDFTFDMNGLGPGCDVMLGIEWIRTERPICNFFKGIRRWPPHRKLVTSPHRKLYVPVTIMDVHSKNIEIIALLDSGFARSTIQQTFAKDHGIAHTYGGPFGPKSTAFNGSDIDEFGRISLNISITDSQGMYRDTCFEFDATGIADDDKIVLGYD